MYEPIDLKETLNYHVANTKIYFSIYYLGNSSKQMVNDIKESWSKLFSDKIADYLFLVPTILLVVTLGSRINTLRLFRLT